MKTILLCGYREGSGLERAEDGTLWIDLKIRELQRLGHEVICVLSGDSADDILRSSRALMDAELVFDTNGATATLATNLKAGLAATDGEGCFATPLEVPCPPPAAWNFLREEWRREGFHTSNHIFQIVTDQGAPWHFGFPLLISRSGNGYIRKLAEFTSLIDTRLKYQHLALRLEANLAPAENPL